MWRRTLRTAFKLSVLGASALTLAEPALAQEGLFGGLRVANRPRAGEDLHPTGRSFGHYDFAPPRQTNEGYYYPDPNAVPAMPPPKAKPARPAAAPKASEAAALPAAVEPSAALPPSAVSAPAVSAPAVGPKVEAPKAVPVDIMLKVDGDDASAPEAKPQSQAVPPPSAAPAAAASAQVEESAEEVAEAELEPIRIRGRRGITLRY